MTEENEEQVIQEVVSEPTDDTQEQQEPTMVPLAALQAERKKRQEEAQERQKAQAKADLYHEYLMRAQAEQQVPAEEEDPTALVEKQTLRETTQATKREILETLYQDMNPGAVQEINTYLKSILEKKPWLAASVDSAPNRYARAYEIVNDYKHLVESKPSQKVVKTNDAERIVANANKPRSPVEIGKSAQPGGMDYLRSIQGKKEFREYRQKLLNGG
jgi:hypothetical protein